MKTIRSQVISTTAVDSHGESIPKDALEKLFNATPDPWLMFNNHDVAKEPMAKAYNKEFVQLESGEWAIRADVDIFDEQMLTEYGGTFGGVSISYSTSTYTTYPNSNAHITVGANPRLFDLDDLGDLVHESTDDVIINVRDIRQKAAEQLPLIIFITFVSGAFFSGFFGEVGKDAYDALKKKLRLLFDTNKKDNDRDLVCHMTFTIQLNGGRTEVLVEASADDIEYLQEKGLDEQYVLEQINKSVADRQVRKIVLKANRNGPLVTMNYFIDTNEDFHAPENGE